MRQEIPDYGYTSAVHGHAHAYLLPTLDAVLDRLAPKRIFDLGCGNGSIANHLSRRCEVVGVDPSPSAVKIASSAYPNIRIELGSAYDDLVSKYGTFSTVISCEVVEHLYDPRLFAKNIYAMLDPGGVAIITTPYHGYIKNLALAVTGKMEAHFTALWDGGHIKFWSMNTLGELLTEAGFKIDSFHRVGRIPVLAKSMIAVARKPA